MSEAPSTETKPTQRARHTLLRRLADVVCLPSSRVNIFERAMTADLLVDILRQASPADRIKVARRLASLSEIPPVLSRMLLRDHVEVARPLLEECQSIGDCDLIDCVHYATVEHRRLIARRRDLPETVCAALVEGREPIVVETLLRNESAALPNGAMETMVADTRENPKYIPALLKRREIRPSHAYALFWWADADCRRVILQRFAVSREVLQDAASDVFGMAMDENWQDPVSRKALQFIERRQRNRAALERSPFNSLDEAVAAAGETGLTRQMAEEIAYLSGLKPMTGAKIFTDAGGEALAILCKATGLPKQNVITLWRALGRPVQDEAGIQAPALDRLLLIYDLIAVDKAQTVLRYWNWSLSSALSPALMKAMRDGDEQALDEFSVPERMARLAFAKDFGR